MLLELRVVLSAVVYDGNASDKLLTPSLLLLFVLFVFPSTPLLFLRLGANWKDLVFSCEPFLLSGRGGCVG